jgi:Methyl-accepting chemotaxis protein
MLGIGIAAGIGINALALSQLRVGGVVYQGLKGNFDLLADILPPPEYVIEPYLEATLAVRDIDHSEMHRQKLAGLQKAYEERKAYWKAQSFDDQKRSLFEEATRSADAFWQEANGSFIPALARNDKDGAEKSYQALSRDYAVHREAIDRLVAAGNKSLDESQAGADHANGVYRIATWSISVLILALLIAVIYGFMRFIVNPVLRFAGATEELAQGRLNTEIPALDRQDEIGELALALATFRDKLVAAEQATIEQNRIIVSSIGTGLDHLAKGDLTHRVTADLSGAFAKLKEDFNTAMTRLQETVKDVFDTTNQINNNAGEISTATNDLSHRTEQQAAALEETAAALDEITATIKETAANANEAARSVMGAKDAAENGGRVVETAIKAMDSIAQSSKQITDIIGVIDEIAFQTNLLALNAGVEAARAGDAGRGFAVVASEVRALAQRSSEAAKQIKALINASSEYVGDGVKYVGETGQALKHIVDQVLQINSLVADMAQASEQQSTGVEQVNAAVGQMDRVTQQNAAMVEQTTAAARGLASEAKSLTEIVGFFSVDETRRATARIHAMPAGPSLNRTSRLAIAG